MKPFGNTIILIALWTIMPLDNPFCIVGVEAISNEENQALCAMVNAIPQLKTTYGWSCNNSSPCGVFKNLECSSGQVTGITLQRTGVSGTIPSQTAMLTNLQVLIMSFTSISGTIPPQLGNFTNLQQLILESTSISGTIPNQLTKLTKLIYLYLSYTSLSGTISSEFSNLTLLQQLDFSYTGLTGTIPSQFGRFVNIQEFFFANTIVSGTIPTQLGKLVNLQQLYISSPYITGTIPTQLNSLTKLTTLNLQNSFTCGCPPSLPSVTSCTLLGMPCNCTTKSNCISSCNNIFICPSVNIPVPNPNDQPVPQPSNPDIEPVPQPSNPDIEPVTPNPNIPQTIPQPSPDVDCQGYFSNELPFACISGKWTAIIEIPVNGASLLNGVFVAPRISVMNTLSISNSTINIKNNLLLQKHSVLKIQDSDLLVGSFIMAPNSTLDLVNRFSIHVNESAFLNGNLVIISTNQSNSIVRLKILTASNINGSFSSISFFKNDSTQCVSVNTEQYQNSIIVSFDISDQCTQKTYYWIYIIIGVAAFIIVIAVVGSIIIVSKNKQQKKKEMEKIKGIVIRENLYNIK